MFMPEIGWTKGVGELMPEIGWTKGVGERAQPPIGLSSDLIGPEKTAVARCANVPITTHCTSELRQPPSGKILLGAAPIETADSPNQILQARN